MVTSQVGYDRAMDDAARSDAEPTLEEALLGAARGLRRRWMADLAPMAIAPHQARVLRVIGRREPVRPGQVAERLRIAARSVTEVVDALVERGLVVRGPDPDDRRATALRLTPEGRRLVDEVSERRRVAADRYFDRLNAQERRTLARLLARLDDDRTTCDPRRTGL